MGKGLTVTNTLFSQSGRSSAKKYAILLSDGRADDSVTTALNTSKNMGIIIYTVGVGSKIDIDEPLLQNIASTTGGVYYYIQDPTALTSIYSKIATRICPSLVAESNAVKVADNPVIEQKTQVAEVKDVDNSFLSFIGKWIRRLFGEDLQSQDSSYAAEP